MTTLSKVYPNLIFTVNSNFHAGGNVGVACLWVVLFVFGEGYGLRIGKNY